MTKARDLATSGPDLGLVYIKKYTPSAVSSFSFDNGTFSATYDAYFVTGFLVTSGSAEINLRLRASGTDETGSNYTLQTLKIRNLTQDGSGETTDKFRISADGATGTHLFNMYVYDPFLASPTGMQANYFSTLPGLGQTGGRHSLSTSYDSMTFIANTGTFTGTIKVYGYKE